MRFDKIVWDFYNLALPLRNVSKRCRRNGKQCKPWSDCSSSTLIRVYTVCLDLPVQKLRVITVNSKVASGWCAGFAIPEWFVWPFSPLPSLIRVFAVRMKKALVLSYPLSAQQRLWLDWANVQPDISLLWQSQRGLFGHSLLQSSLWKTEVSRNMTKPTKWVCAQRRLRSASPSEDSDQPGHLPSLIRVFAVRMKKAWVLSYALSAQRRHWSDWVNAQADLSLRCFAIPEWFVRPFSPPVFPVKNRSEPRHDKTNKMSPPSLIRVFAVRMKKAWVFSYPLSAQQRLRSDWADAQADLSLCWVHSHFVGFVMSWLKSCFHDFVISDILNSNT